VTEFDRVSDADLHRKRLPVHSNGHVVGFHENGKLPVSAQNGVSHGHYGGRDVNRKYERSRIPSGDSGIHSLSIKVGKY